MRSWIRVLPEGASVQLRTVNVGVVETVWGGRGEVVFDARVAGAVCHLGSGVVAPADLGLLAQGAWFWLVHERVARPDGWPQDLWQVRFVRDGVRTVEQAFGQDGSETR